MLTRSSTFGPDLWAAYEDPNEAFDPDRAVRYAVVLIKAAGEGPFLLQERPRSDDVEYRGRFSMFGGRREGEESAEGCAIREVLEETGLELKAADLTLLARVESQNESGRLTSGHLFLAEGLSFDALKALDISDGKGVFMKRNEVPRQWGRLTSIAHFAIAAYEELDRVRLERPTPASPARASFFKFARR
ncbi:MAG: NUDIX domain-containing protein [Alphaproteobacteria bacterium]|nr:NUDIX domain-containing protein [Alphaproteobacteria bacterium]